MTGRGSLREALAELAGVLDASRLRWMLIGGLAVIARGVPRHTVDVDATVWGDGLDVERLIQSLEAAGFRSRVDHAAALARQAQMLLLTHRASGVGVDVSLAWLPFEEAALTQAEPLDFGAGVIVPTARPEDLIVYKAVAWRERDRTDIVRLLRLYPGEVDLARVRHLVGQFAEVLEAPERVSEFDVLVRQATE